eukprot:CAMPEP_0176248394 /NCGR_PEP_ID=MMETSP0121_2-20121125/33444_1 /TAXON_ID=160619 /ORGANISM="Kryptoperidinium foliaceum, Strain CCMP 1326" /LENGTH=37 /DNA_ID= /DNA_START= /DNA_END= /DNA_ORIENTATION=
MPVPPRGEGVTMTLAPKARMIFLRSTEKDAAITATKL